jgi:hypothetical protein
MRDDADDALEFSILRRRSAGNARQELAMYERQWHRYCPCGAISSTSSQVFAELDHRRLHQGYGRIAKCTAEGDIFGPPTTPPLTEKRSPSTSTVRETLSDV